jgi:hypothetical protein
MGAGPNWPPSSPVASSEDETWGSRSSKRMRIEPFDVLMFAVGFGRENSSSEFQTVKSYWQDDNIDRDDLYTKNPINRVLISGTGTEASLISFDTFSATFAKSESLPSSKKTGCCAQTLMWLVKNSRD